MAYHLFTAAFACTRRCSPALHNSSAVTRTTLSCYAAPRAAAHSARHLTRLHGSHARSRASTRDDIPSFHLRLIPLSVAFVAVRRSALNDAQHAPQVSFAFATGIFHSCLSACAGVAISGGAHSPSTISRSFTTILCTTLSSRPAYLENAGVGQQ